MTQNKSDLMLGAIDGMRVTFQELMEVLEKAIISMQERVQEVREAPSNARYQQLLMVQIRDMTLTPFQCFIFSQRVMCASIIVPAVHTLGISSLEGQDREKLIAFLTAGKDIKRDFAILNHVIAVKERMTLMSEKLTIFIEEMSALPAQSAIMRIKTMLEYIKNEMQGSRAQIVEEENQFSTLNAIIQFTVDYLRINSDASLAVFTGA